MDSSGRLSRRHEDEDRPNVPVSVIPAKAGIHSAEASNLLRLGCMDPGSPLRCGRDDGIQVAISGTTNLIPWGYPQGVVKTVPPTTSPSKEPEWI
jgi:hypothetical protein